MIGIPAEAGDQPFHQRADAARAGVGNRAQCIGVEQELLVLGADAPDVRSALSRRRSRRPDRRASHTGGLGALSSRVDIRRLFLKVCRAATLARV